MTTRRSFSETLIHVFGGLMTAALGGLGGSYLLNPAKKKRATGVARGDNKKKVSKIAKGQRKR